MTTFLALDETCLRRSNQHDYRFMTGSESIYPVIDSSGKRPSRLSMRLQIAPYRTFYVPNGVVYVDNSHMHKSNSLKTQCNDWVTH